MNPTENLPGMDPAMHDPSPASTLCPSARPDLAGGVVFGVRAGTVDEPRVAYLTESVPVTLEVLALAGPVDPAQVFRIAAPCAGTGCRHFDGASCGLASRIVQLLPEVVGSAPPCDLRPTCRWWSQEGKAACLRCPQIVSLTLRPTEALRLAADPASPTSPVPRG